MAKKRSSTNDPESSGKDEHVDFERALAEVEQIVHRLESGELDLTESLQQYENGVRQLKNCHAILHAAERRVTVLSGMDADGNAITEPLPGAESTPGAEPGRGVGNDQGPTNQGIDHIGESTMDDSPGLF